MKRAEQLVSFVTTDPAMTRFGVPVAVFATQTTKDDNGQRTQETVTPLARALKLPVQTPYLGKDYAALATLILANPAYDGKTVLICWNHEQITQLAAALGVTPRPPKWKGSVFDRVYVISYHDGKAALAIQAIILGDAMAPPGDKDNMAKSEDKAVAANAAFVAANRARAEAVYGGFGTLGL